MEIKLLISSLSKRTPSGIFLSLTISILFLGIDQLLAGKDWIAVLFYNILVFIAYIVLRIMGLTDEQTKKLLENFQIYTSISGLKKVSENQIEKLINANDGEKQK